MAYLILFFFTNKTKVSKQTCNAIKILAICHAAHFTDIKMTTEVMNLFNYVEIFVRDLF